MSTIEKKINESPSDLISVSYYELNGGPLKDTYNKFGLEFIKMAFNKMMMDMTNDPRITYNSQMECSHYG